MYKLRAAVDVADASSEWGVWWWKGGEGGGGPPPPQSVPLCSLFRPDPRGVPGLGWRAVLPLKAAQEAGLTTSEEGGAPGPASLTAARFRLGVAEGSELSGLMPLEAGLDGLKGIAFDKGCYVGQELVARTHFRGEVRKRVVGFEQGAAGGGAVPEAGSALSVPGGEGSPSPSRPAGTVLASDAASRTGLALVRTATALPAGEMESESGGRVRLVRPPWWPAGWAGA